MTLATIHKGWNVWGLLAARDLSFSPLWIGVSPERRLRAWVEDHADAAPGANVADQWNPARLKGEAVEILQAPEGLEAETERTEISPPVAPPADNVRVFVRFFNRGVEASTPWPHDEDFALDTIYAPSKENPITSAPEPPTLEGAAGAALDTAGSALKVVGVIAGVVLLGGIVLALANQRRAA
jgi:hypothetical protein